MSLLVAASDKLLAHDHMVVKYDCCETESFFFSEDDRSACSLHTSFTDRKVACMLMIFMSLLVLSLEHQQKTYSVLGFSTDSAVGAT